MRREFFAPVGLFGIAVRAGLLAYEVYTRGCQRAVRRPVIYPAVLAAWTYLVLFFVDRPLGRVISAMILVVGLAGGPSLRQVPQGARPPSIEPQSTTPRQNHERLKQHSSRSASQLVGPGRDRDLRRCSVATALMSRVD